MRFRPLTRPLKSPRRARVVAALALMTLFFGVAFVALGVISLEGAILALALASFLSCLALVLASYTIVRIWQDTGVGTFDAMLSALWAVPVLVCAGLLSYVITQTVSYPDLSTDVDNPPTIISLAPVDQDLPLDVATAEERIRVQLDHPDLTSLYVLRPGWHVAEVISEFIQTSDWQSERYDSVAGRRFEIEMLVPGRMPLIEHTIALRLVDDGEGTIIDARSFSNMPLHDFGMNAPVLMDVLDKIALAIEATPPPTSDL